MSEQFNYSSYLIRKKLFKLLGEDFYIYGPSENLVLYAHLKPFQWKEDIRLYSDETKTVELLTIKARKALDFSATYDVFDPQTGEKVGALKRHGFKSMLQDEWTILDIADQQIGIMKEDNQILALVRRFLSNLVPQEFELFLGQQKALHVKQLFTWFGYRLQLTFSTQNPDLLDKRLGVAAGILIAAIEGRQE